MKKTLLAAALATLPLFAGAVDLNINVPSVRIDAPGVSITFGARNERGYYWDGGEWRDPVYWRRHDGPRGEKYYTGRGKGAHHDGGFCPPGQAKKGNC
ncbi:DUF2502 domain-containing protein [Azoarcus sp. KH32C]|uniref:DUF2502 domain-containing protein n=1 Tax=Azoarcus sp. KH32C TaxID=748247 RepID=UPI0002385CDF|nr:DUF2502 domain-containing protein [Azoarcus sp. KH32C]BAL26949.1 hypothetical protein AZKH_p0066 [Azoarcus sp. KH32C]